MMKHTLRVSLITASASLLPPFMALAQGREYTSPINAKSIQDVIALVIKFAMEIISPLAALAILVAAWLYVTSQGDPKKIEQAHRAITYGVIGLLIVFSGNYIINIIKGAAGELSASQSFAIFIGKIAMSFGQVIMGVSVLMILYSAYLFMTGGGDPKKVSQARQALTFALIGVAVALLAIAIPGIIRDILVDTLP